MNRLAGFFPGIAMLVVGAAKVWTHTQSLQAFLSVRCGPEGLSSAETVPHSGRACLRAIAGVARCLLQVLR